MCHSTEDRQTAIAKLLKDYKEIITMLTRAIETEIINILREMRTVTFIFPEISSQPLKEIISSVNPNLSYDVIRYWGEYSRVEHLTVREDKLEVITRTPCGEQLKTNTPDSHGIENLLNLYDFMRSMQKAYREGNLTTDSEGQITIKP